MKDNCCEFCSISETCHLNECYKNKSKDILLADQFIRFDPTERQKLRNWKTDPTELFEDVGKTIILKMDGGKYLAASIDKYGKLFLGGYAPLNYHDLNNSYKILGWITLDELLVSPEEVRNDMRKRIVQNIIPDKYKCSECECNDICKKTSEFLCGAREFFNRSEEILESYFLKIKRSQWLGAKTYYLPSEFPILYKHKNDKNYSVLNSSSRQQDFIGKIELWMSLDLLIPEEGPYDMNDQAHLNKLSSHLKS